MRRLLCIAVLFAMGMMPQTVFGQLNQNAIGDFQSENPMVQFYERDGAQAMIYGSAFSTGDSPLDSAWNHVNQWGQLYGAEIGALLPEVKEDGEVLVGVMPNASGNYKFYTFRFNQTYNNIPVFRSGIGFLVRNQDDYPLVLTGFDVKDTTEFAGIGGAAGAPTVTETMLANVGELMDDYEHGYNQGFDEENQGGNQVQHQEEESEPSGMVSVLDNSIAQTRLTPATAPAKLKRGLRNSIKLATQPLVGRRSWRFCPLHRSTSPMKRL